MSNYVSSWNHSAYKKDIRTKISDWEGAYFLKLKLFSTFWSTFSRCLIADELVILPAVVSSKVPNVSIYLWVKLCLLKLVDVTLLNGHPDCWVWWCFFCWYLDLDSTHSLGTHDKALLEIDQRQKILPTNPSVPPSD